MPKAQLQGITTGPAGAVSMETLAPLGLWLVVVLDMPSAAEGGAPVAAVGEQAKSR